MKIFNSLLALLIASSFYGCAEVMNPYSEEFGCPDGDYGSCTDVTRAYDKSFQENDEDFSPMVKVKTGGRDVSPASHATPGAGEGTSVSSDQSEIYDYQKALLTELQGVISDEKTPMLVPARQMRLLVLGYEDDHMSYYSHRYVYFIAEPQRWVLPTNRIGIPLKRPETLFRQ